MAQPGAALAQRGATNGLGRCLAAYPAMSEPAAPEELAEETAADGAAEGESELQPTGDAAGELKPKAKAKGKAKAKAKAKNGQPDTQISPKAKPKAKAKSAPKAKAASSKAGSAKRPRPEDDKDEEEAEEDEGDEAAEPDGEEVPLDDDEIAEAQELLDAKIAKKEARAQLQREAREAARAAAEPFETLHTKNMTPQQAAKWHRAFQAALLKPAAEECGLAAMAETVKHMPDRKRRQAWSALAHHWHTHGFEMGQYVPATSLSKTQSSTTIVHIMPRCKMIGQCGGEASFQQGLSAGDVEEVRCPKTNKLCYRWTASQETEGVSVTKELKANSMEAAGVLACMSVELGHEATGVVPRPLESPAAQRALPAMLPLEDASEGIKLRLKLEQARAWSDTHLYKAKQASQLLHADGPSSAKHTILSCLTEATAQSTETAKHLVAECSKWLTGKMTKVDSAAALDLLAKSSLHFENLTAWTKAAQAATTSKKLLA